MSTATRHISVPRMEADPTVRAEIIADAREMLDWLEAHPHVPLWAHGMRIQWTAGTRDGVERLAARMDGPEVTHCTAAHLATKWFGRAAYVAYAPNLDVAP